MNKTNMYLLIKKMLNKIEEKSTKQVIDDSNCLVIKQTDMTNVLFDTVDEIYEDDSRCY